MFTGKQMIGRQLSATSKNPKVKKKVIALLQREARDFPLITFRFRTRSRCRKLVGRSVRIVLCSREKQWILKLSTTKWRK